MKLIHSQRAKLRLPRIAYKNTKAIFSVTFVTRCRTPFFNVRRLALPTVEVLVDHARSHDVTLHGFCVMPDHVHAVVTPSRALDVVDYVAQTKNLAQRRAWDSGVRGLIWQPRFWDTYVRKTEEGDELYEHIAYVLDNPVRKSIVDVWTAYEFSGSPWIPKGGPRGDETPLVRLGINPKLRRV
jgi:REP element-mobilizing transposase RayT